MQKFPDIKTVAFVGGVSANTKIRETLNDLLRSRGLPDLVVPKSLEFCTDNAAMIGSAGFLSYQNDKSILKHQFVDSNSRLVL